MGVDFGVICAADFDNAIRVYVRRPNRRPRVARRHTNILRKRQIYRFGVIWTADFNNLIRFYVRHPARRPRVTRFPLSHQNFKKTTDISLWVSILGLFVPLISIMT